MCKQRQRWGYGLILLMLSSLAMASSVTYHWVDADGNTRFSDAMPGREAVHGYRVIDPNTGRVIREVARAKTPEEREQQRLTEQRLAEKEQHSQSQQEQDEILLALYSSVDSIIEARERHMASIEARINRNQAAASRMERLIQHHPESSQAYERDLANLEAHIAQLRAERDEIILDFHQQIERFRAITNSE